MRLCVLASSSSGNSYVITDGEVSILVDAGISFRKLTERMISRCGLLVERLDGILITHEHRDHTQGLEVLLKRCEAPVYMTRGTLLSLGLDLPSSRLRLVTPLVPFWIGGFRIFPAPVIHDAAEPVGYVFHTEHARAGILTDLGNVYRETLELYSSLDLLVLEFNHDPQMLREGPYPPPLKRRIASERGHLSNELAASLLETLGMERLKALVLAHLSEKNNTPDRAYEAAIRAIGDRPVKVDVASRDGLAHPIDALRVRHHVPFHRRDASRP